MPNIKSAKKRVIVNDKKNAGNRSANAEVKTAMKKVNAAIEAGDKAAATEAYKAAAKLIDCAVSAKLLEFCNEDREVIDRQFVDVEINVFVEGLTCEYVKYCRGYSAVTLDELYAYTKRWVRKFAEERKVRRVK